MICLFDDAAQPDEESFCNLAIFLALSLCHPSTASRVPYLLGMPFTDRVYILGVKLQLTLTCDGFQNAIKCQMSHFDVDLFGGRCFLENVV